MAKIRVITADIADKLQEMYRYFKSMNPGTTGRPWTNPEVDYLPPELHIALTPAEGIPSLSVGTGPDGSDVPGRATCNVYQILEDAVNNPYLEEIPDLDRDVHNLSETEVSGDEWVQINRDKHGRWIVVTGGGGGTGEEWAMITAKCYYDGSDLRNPADDFTPIGEGLNCPPNLACLRRFIIYSAIGVDISGGTSDCPLVFTENGRKFSPNCNPLYHVANIDLPVYPPTSPRIHGPNTALSMNAEETGTGTGTGTGFGAATWTTVSNALTSNDTYAECTLAPGQSSDFLVLSGFCFGFAGNTTFDTIAALIEAAADGDGVRDLQVYLMVNGDFTGVNKATGVDLPTTDTVRTYSHTPTDWGFPLLKVREVNQTNFGVVLRYRNFSGGTRTVKVDVGRLSVAFAPAGVTIPRHAVVRIWKGDGDWYEMDQMPWVDLHEYTNDEDADGTISYFWYYDQNDDEWKRGEETRLVLSGN